MFPDSKGRIVSVLPRATGSPDPEAADMIGWIRGFARQPPADDRAERIQHVRDILHVNAAVWEALRIAMATANRPGPGRASLRAMEAELGIHKDTIKYHVDQGKTLLADDPDAAIPISYHIPRTRPATKTATAPRLLVELRRRAETAPQGVVIINRTELAEVLGVTLGTVRIAIADLADTGLITIEGPDTYQVPGLTATRGDS